MKEAPIEDYLDNRVKALGGFTRKVTYQGRKGALDRWCFFPSGLLLIIETKRPGKKPDTHQEEEMENLSRMGQHVYYADSKERVDEILGEWF
jgi:hypothetical protein